MPLGKKRYTNLEQNRMITPNQFSNFSRTNKPTTSSRVGFGFDLGDISVVFLIQCQPEIDLNPLDCTYLYVMCQSASKADPFHKQSIYLRCKLNLRSSRGPERRRSGLRLLAGFARYCKQVCLPGGGVRLRRLLTCFRRAC